MIGTQGHLPFGESWYSTGTVDKWKFTSYERDSDTNLDYAIIRFDSARLARFTSPDPYSGSADPADPQSWDRYAYVMNDPNDYDDPLGLSCSIALNNSLNLLNPDQLQALGNELQRLLDLANADATVGTTAGADLTFNLTVSQNPSSLNSKLSNTSTVGYTIPLADGSISDRGYVFTDVLDLVGSSYPPFGQNSLAIGIGAGRAGFHEFLHNALQVGNSGHVPGTPFQSGFSPAQYFGTNPSPSIWNPSKSQIAAIQAKCGQKKKTINRGGAGGGGGYAPGGVGNQSAFYWFGLLFSGDGGGSGYATHEIIY